MKQFSLDFRTKCLTQLRMEGFFAGQRTEEQWVGNMRDHFKSEQNGDGELPIVPRDISLPCCIGLADERLAWHREVSKEHNTQTTYFTSYNSLDSRNGLLRQAMILIELGFSVNVDRETFLPTLPRKDRGGFAFYDQISFTVGRQLFTNYRGRHENGWRLDTWRFDKGSGLSGAKHGACGWNLSWNSPRSFQAGVCRVLQLLPGFVVLAETMPQLEKAADLIGNHKYGGAVRLIRDLGEDLVSSLVLGNR